MGFSGKIDGGNKGPFKIFSGKNINFVQAEISAVDLKTKNIKTKGGEVLFYDCLVIALGSQTADFGIPGVREYAYQFKSIKYGTSAVIAMLHDSLVLLGTFSLLGHFMGAEIDFLFVTAMLTILSFSVHDTIVVYDRTRETQKKYGGDMETIANKALTETMVRSLNNSMTIVFMLIALILLGGETIKWFAVALLVGTISGTYSSPFVAVPILVTWDKLIRRKN